MLKKSVFHRVFTTSVLFIFAVNIFSSSIYALDRGKREKGFEPIIFDPPIPVEYVDAEEANYDPRMPLRREDIPDDYVFRIDKDFREQGAFEEQTRGDEDEFIDFRNSERFYPRKILESPIKQNLKGKLDIRRPQPVNKYQKISLPALLSSLFSLPKAYAESADPLMPYYDGIEENPLDHMLYYLSNTQNEDGSYGYNNKFELSSEVATLLAQYNLIDNDNFEALVNYLTNATPQNSREKAIAARWRYAHYGSGYKNLLNDMDSTLGAYGISDYYQPDLITSLEALYSFGATNHKTEEISEILSFVLNQIKPDGSIGYQQGTNSSYYLMYKTVEYLKPFENYAVEINEGEVFVKDKLDLVVNYLDAQNVDSQDSVDRMMKLSSLSLNSGDEELKNSLQDLVGYEIDYSNGGIDNSLYATIAGIKLFSRADLQITGISTTTHSPTTNSAFTLLIDVENKGNATAYNVNLHQFLDNYDSAEYNVPSIPAGSTSTISIDFSPEQAIFFVGNTNLQFYIEAENETSYDNNWLAEDFQFAPSLDGTPGLPSFFVAHDYKISSPGVNVRWNQVKNDPNRAAYIISLHKLSTDEWYFYTAGNLSAGKFVVNLAANEAYDVDVGVIHSDGETVTMFNNPVSTLVSASNAENTGSVSGYLNNNSPILNSVKINGFGDASTLTDENGNFTLSKIKNGSNAIKVSKKPYQEIWTSFEVGASEEVVDIELFTHFQPDYQAPTYGHTEIEEFAFIENPVIENGHAYTLNATGVKDNVLPKEVDFYYYDPLGSWEYIGTAPADGSVGTSSVGVAKLSWFIPTTLKGAGFKLKSVAYDFAGNASEENYWTTDFEIVDQPEPYSPENDVNPPEGEFFVSSFSTPSDPTWILGAYHNAEWKLTDEGDIQNLTMKLHYNGQVETIASNLAPEMPNKASNYYVHDLQNDPKYISQDSYLSLYACDYSNNCTTFYTEKFNIIGYESNPPEGEVVVQNLVDSIQWELGTEKTIDISVNDQSPLALGKLAIKLAGGTYIIAANLDVNHPLALDYTVPQKDSYQGLSYAYLLWQCDIHYNCKDINSNIFIFTPATNEDTEAPVVSDMKIDGYDGNNPKITAQAKDNKSTIAAAEYYYLDKDGDKTGPYEIEGPNGVATEVEIFGEIDTSAWHDSYPYEVFFRAQDFAGNWSEPVGLVFTEEVAPTLENLQITGITETNGKQYLGIEALATDVGGGVSEANYYYIDSAAVASQEIAMSASDGAFGDNTESISAQIDISNWENYPYTIYVKAVDGSGNWSNELQVQFVDDFSPSLSNLSFGDVYQENNIYYLPFSFQADDETGFIKSAKYNYENSEGTLSQSFSLNAQDGQFDEVQEIIEGKVNLDAFEEEDQFPYTLLLFASDDNSNLSVPLTATIEENHDGYLDPKIDNLEFGEKGPWGSETIVQLNATVSGGQSNILKVKYYTIDKDGNELILSINGGKADMVAVDGSFDSTNEEATINYQLSSLPLSKAPFNVNVIAVNEDGLISEPMSLEVSKELITGLNCDVATVLKVGVNKVCPHNPITYSDSSVNFSILVDAFREIFLIPVVESATGFNLDLNSNNPLFKDQTIEFAGNGGAKYIFKYLGINSFGYPQIEFLKQ